MKAPPSSGPMTDDIPNKAPTMPTKMGLFLNGTICVTMTVDPAVMPAQPTPAIARPMMKAVELGAAPHRAEPTSKTMMVMRYTILVE